MRSSRCLILVILIHIVIFPGAARGQKHDSIDPVRVGDQVEYKWFSEWKPCTVKAYANGVATVEYPFGTTTSTRECPLKDLRFPNGEGPWMIWSDSTGKFKVEARYLSRTATHVTIRKADKTESTVPIAALNPALRREIAKTPITGEELKVNGAVPVKIGDKIQVKYHSKWYDGTVKQLKPEVAVVDYKYGSFGDRTGEFKISDMRFPNGEGPWREWSDSSGKFKVIARYISRTATHVTIRKEDGTDASVPIASLNPELRKQVAKTTITGEENKFNGAVPVRVGDKVQAKSFFTWYDGTVKEVTKEGAVVEYKYGNFGNRTSEFKFADMRFPNGEGPWREWSDVSGNFKIIGRYISRDETHVTIRKEDGTDLRVEINLLSPTLRRALIATSVLTKRPPEIEFTVPAGTFASRQDLARSMARNQDASGVPELAGVSLPVGAPVVGAKLSQGGVAFELEQGDKVSKVIPIGGAEQWVLVGTHGKGSDGPAPAMLFWTSPGKKTKVAGPKFLADERVMAYSAKQSRLITAVVQGTWDVPTRLCSYRIEPGESKAVPEMSWPVPKPTGASSGSAIHLELVGQDRLLMGYGSSVSMWNLTSKSAEYAINGVTRPKFWLSPDHRYFAAFDSRKSLSVYDSSNGNRLARQSWDAFGFATAGFSQDGSKLICANAANISAWNLPDQEAVVELPLGGISVRDNTPLSLLSGGWVVAGPQFYSMGLKMVVWRYDFRGVTLQHQQMIGNQMLAVALANGREGKKNVLVGVASVPHKDAIELMKKVDTTKLVMLKRGSRVSVQSSGDARIVNGIKRAVQANGWIEDPNSDISIRGSAGLGDAETRTYRSFGTLGGGEETHTVRPWRQVVEIMYGDQRAWGTSTGAVPSFVTYTKESSLGEELGKSSRSSYSLFENLKIPEQILYPRYQRGLGQTWITASGFVDQAK